MQFFVLKGYYIEKKYGNFIYMSHPLRGLLDFSSYFKKHVLSFDKHLI